MSIKPRNLEQKVSILLDETEKMTRSEATRRIVNFICEELEWRSADYVLDDHDLAIVKSNAVSAMQEFSMQMMREYGFENGHNSDQDKMRTLCWINAVVSYFRGKQAIPFTASYLKKGRKT
jgi:hypothetical protein